MMTKLEAINNVLWLVRLKLVRTEYYRHGLSDFMGQTYSLMTIRGYEMSVRYWEEKAKGEAS